MSCFEQSTFLPNQEVVDQKILKEACDKLGWKYTIRGNTMQITDAGSRTSMRGENALTITNNRVKWNTYYMRGGAGKRDQLRSTYTELFNEMRVAYAKEAVLSAFKARGFNRVDDLNFVSDAQIKHRFYLKSSSKLPNESDPVAKIRVAILADGTVQTDSNYIPEDVHVLADEAMATIEGLLGTQRSIKPKVIPAKYRTKAFCKPKNNIQLKQKGL